jgi:hypothetical protein
MTMRISKNRVFESLTRCQIEKGGYTGSDDTILANKNIPVSPQALRISDIDWRVTQDDIEKLIFHPALFERCRVRPKIPTFLEGL